MDTLRALSGPAKTAGIVALLGFVISIESTSTRTSNGRLVECSSTDFGAIGLGVVAGVVGIVAMVGGWRDDDRLSAAVGAAAVVVGVVHLLMGTSTVGGPCN